MKFRTNRTIEDYQRIFRSFMKLEAEANRYVAIRKAGIFGIAVDSDQHAIQWRRKEYSREVMRAFLSGRKAPNAHCASWIPAGRAQQIMEEVNAVSS